MENENKNEATVGSLEELKEMVRALPDGMVLSVRLEREDADGQEERI